MHAGIETSYWRVGCVAQEVHHFGVCVWSAGQSHVAVPERSVDLQMESGLRCRLRRAAWFLHSVDPVRRQIKIQTMCTDLRCGNLEHRNRPLFSYLNILIFISYLFYYYTYYYNFTILFYYNVIPYIFIMYYIY